MTGDPMHPSSLALSVPDRSAAMNSTSADEFRFFQRLPPELRMMIWGYALDLENEDKEAYFDYRGVGLSNSFISNLFMVNWESRVVALRRYSDAHPVYRYLDPWSSPVSVGVVRFNHSDDALYLRRDVPALSLRLSCYPTQNRVDNILVPTLNVWLYQHSHRCYYVDNSNGDSCLLSDFLSRLDIQMPKPGDPPPQQWELDDFFKSLCDETEEAVESHHSTRTIGVDEDTN